MSQPGFGHGSATGHDTELRLVVTSPAVLDVLCLMGLDRMLRIYPSLDEALAIERGLATE